MKIRSSTIALAAALALLPATLLHADSLGDALNAPELDWTTGGDAAWFSQTETTHDGAAAAQSGTLTNLYTQSWLQTTVTGRVAVVFWWKSASAIPSTFGFYFYTNNNYVQGIYGSADWRQMAVSFAGGTNTLKWQSYLYDNLTNGPAATNWIDEVVVTNIDGLKPTLLAQPAPAVSVPENYPDPTTLQASAIGDLPMTYQWRRSGTNLTDGWPYYGVTTPSLTLYARTTNDAGDYQLVLSNAWGTATSEVCAVSIVPSKPWVDPSQPEDVVLAQGAFYSWWPSIYGTAPFTFQWFKDGEPIPSDENPYATNSYFYFFSAFPEDEGGYSLVVSNAYGACTSRVAQVTVTGRAQALIPWFDLTVSATSDAPIQEYRPN